LADDDTTRVYDLRDDKWNAVISNGSGGMGKNVNVEFGRDEDEVLIWSDFAGRVMVWCLKTGRTVDIRDPKFSGKDSRGWGYRPCGEEQGVGGRGSVLALLCRSPGVDVLMLLAPKTYAVLKRVDLATQDAQGVRWSRDGRWLAVWDAASVGYSLCIYTADGHLYRTISRELPDELNEWGIEGLGIKTVEWVPGNEWLAVGGWDRRVRILSTKTFSPVVYLDHTAEICVPSASVYTEQIDARGFRSFELAQQPATPPKAPVEKHDTGLMKQGISTVAFNKDGTLCATRDDSTPTTVWIWDLRSLQPRTILILHSPVKALQWHPSYPSHLLIQSAHDSPTLYLYTALSFSSSTSSSGHPAAGPPTILSLSDNLTKPAGSVPAKWTARWLNTQSDKKPAMVVGHQQGYILVWPEGKDQILRFEGQDEDESDDSLYDILTGRTPVPPLRDSARRRSHGSEYGGEYVDGIGAQSMQGLDSTGSFEDTFRERRDARSRGRSVFDESGLDEMF
jgi:WD40 repeat protein